MSIKIYQAFYKDEQLPNLDAEFTPYDNRANPVNNLYEHYIYHQVRKAALAEGVEKWGVFSWQWKNKLQGIDADLVLKTVAGADADVVIFNAYPWDEIEAYNIWEQGEWSHPGIVDLASKLLTLMGEDPTLIMQPMDRTTYCAANYFVGNQLFWDGLLEFLDRFVAAIDQLQGYDKAKLLSSAGYGPNPKLDYTGFICERLISTYLVKEQSNLNIGAWVPYDDQRSTMKQQAVMERDRNLMLQWDFQRNAKGPKIATAWIDKTF